MSEINYDKDFFDPGINEKKEKCKKKIENLKILYDQGFKEEAITLCCLYIENLTKIFKITDENGRSHKDFCDALLDYSQIDIFKKIKLLRVLNKKKHHELREKILNFLKKLDYKLAQQDDGEIIVDYKNGGTDYPGLLFDNQEKLKSFLSEKVGLSPQEISQLNFEYGSIASQLYESLRCNAVHQGLVEVPRVNGEPLDFDILYQALNNIFQSSLMGEGENKLREILNQKSEEKIVKQGCPSHPI
jgi:hypothetical protein